ncbi:hypothetical protein [Aquimarina brevivitae]|uniref:Uncharacterized protein n=1 Tax=Aquimarina brevivitae TaxID=323412 RepID=A0A4Q7P230_9FLAO|nr:hypothetical protein [Aquimarina brevivitae]RZS93440.1 hypothetical protein EV197_2018 [Aquimarina brevivitae]
MRKSYYTKMINLIKPCITLKVQFILILFILLTINDVHSQNNISNVELELFSKIKLKDRSVPIKILGQDSTGYYILYGNGRYGQKSKSIIKFNLDFTPTDQEKVILNTKEEPNTEYLGTIQLNSNEIVFFTVTNEGESFAYYYEKIQLKQLKVSAKEFIKREEIDQYEFEYVNHHLFKPNPSYTAIVYEFFQKGTKKRLIKALYFDNNFSNITEQRYELPQTSKEFKWVHMRLIDDGSIFLLAKNMYSKNHFDYTLYHLKNNQFNILHELDKQEHYISDVQSILTENEFILSGYYSDISEDYMKGIFLYKLNLKNPEVHSIVYSPLKKEYFLQLLNENKANRVSEEIDKGNYEESYFDLRKIYRYENGDMVLIGEYRDTFYADAILYFVRQDLAIIKINKKGEILWSTKIGKNNTDLSTDMFGDNYIFSQDDSIYLIYNGNFRNLNHTSGKLFKMYSPGTSIILLKIDKEGNYFRESLYTTVQSDNYMLGTNFAGFRDGDALILLTHKMNNIKKQQFFKLNLVDQEKTDEILPTTNINDK